MLAVLFLFGLTLQPFEAVEPHMGTLIRIKLYAPDRQQAAAAFEAGFRRIRELDEALSDYNPKSELNRLCRQGVGHPVPVSDDLFRVLEASQAIARESGGAFDITVGPLTRLWRQGRVPEAANLASALARVGYRKLRLDSGARTAQLDLTDMQLDLGGIAKGYAADEALRAIAKLGIASAMVAASGDLAFSGPPPGQTGWKIGIDLADRPDAAFSRVLLLSNAAVSTSGNTEQHVDSGGKRYSHIIDPATGLGLTRDLRVTVIAPRGIMADALCTAVSVLGSTRGLALIEKQPGTAAIVINKAGRTAESERFRLLTAEPL